MTWLINLLLGELAKVLGAVQSWLAGQPVSVFVQIGDVRLKITAEGQRRLIIERL